VVLRSPSHETVPASLSRALTVTASPPFRAGGRTGNGLPAAVTVTAPGPGPGPGAGRYGPHWHCQVGAVSESFECLARRRTGLQSRWPGRPPRPQPEPRPGPAAAAGSARPWQDPGPAGGPRPGGGPLAALDINCHGDWRSPTRFESLMRMLRQA
jgi:hypothetical protein